MQTGSLVPPQGLETLPETWEKTGVVGLVPPRVPPSRAIDDDGAEELLAIWAALDQGDRADLMAVARGLAGHRDGVV